MYGLERTKNIQSSLNNYFDDRKWMLGKYHFPKYFSFYLSPIIQVVIAILMSQICICKLAHIRVNAAKFYHQSNLDRSILIIF